MGTVSGDAVAAIGALASVLGCRNLLHKTPETLVSTDVDLRSSLCSLNGRSRAALAVLSVDRATASRTNQWGAFFASGSHSTEMCDKLSSNTSIFVHADLPTRRPGRLRKTCPSLEIPSTKHQRIVCKGALTSSRHRNRLWCPIRIAVADIVQLHLTAEAEMT